MTAFPQYAKTCDAEVISAIERNKAGQAAVRERAHEFAKKHGDAEGNFYFSTFAGYRCTGIVSSEKPATGQWKRTSRTHNGWLPYKNNPLHEEFDALAFRPEGVPGIPDLLHGSPERDGTVRVGSPTLFVLDGVAFSGTTIQATDPFPDAGGWEELKASEFHAAMETYNERLKEVAPDGR